MSADASNDDEVRVQGAPGYEFLSALESVAAEAAPVVVAAEFPAGSDEEDDSGAEEGESASESEEARSKWTLLACAFRRACSWWCTHLLW